MLWVWPFSIYKLITYKEKKKWHVIGCVEYKVLHPDWDKWFSFLRLSHTQTCHTTNKAKACSSGIAW